MTWKRFSSLQGHDAKYNKEDKRREKRIRGCTPVGGPKVLYKVSGEEGAPEETRKRPPYSGRDKKDTSVLKRRDKRNGGIV